MQIIARIAAVSAAAFALAAPSAQALPALFETSGFFGDGAELDGGSLDGREFLLLARFDTADLIEVGSTAIFPTIATFLIDGVGEATSLPGEDLFVALGETGGLFAAGLVNEAITDGFVYEYDMRTEIFGPSGVSGFLFSGYNDVDNGPGLAFDTDAGVLLFGDFGPGPETSRVTIDVRPEADVPLPAAGALLIGGLAGLAAVRRRGARAGARTTG